MMSIDHSQKMYCGEHTSQKVNRGQTKPNEHTFATRTAISVKNLLPLAVKRYFSAANGAAPSVDTVPRPGWKSLKPTVYRGCPKLFSELDSGGDGGRNVDRWRWRDEMVQR